MSARVLNPAMMSEMGHRGGIIGGGATRVIPSRAALDRVRRDLFGPVDHAAARALAERELRAQSLLDAERWGFDFHLGKPRANPRWDWKPTTAQDVIPEPYALRGMPYLRKHAPSSPRKSENPTTTENGVKTWTRKRLAATSALVSPITNNSAVPRKAERTPPQEPRVPIIGENTSINGSDEDSSEDTCTIKKKCVESQVPTTPVLPATARKQQSSITDYMKINKNPSNRKRSLNGSTKSIVELPEKIARNAGQIRS